MHSFVAFKKRELEAERIIMAGVPGWEVGKSVYNTDKYVPDAKLIKLGEPIA